MVRREVLRMIAHLILIHMKYLVRKYPPQRLGVLRILLEVELEMWNLAKTMKERLKSKVKVHQQGKRRLAP